MQRGPAQAVLCLQVHYLEGPASSYVKAAVQTVQDIHREGLPGDILVFLTGMPPLYAYWAGNLSPDCSMPPAAMSCESMLSSLPA